MDTRHGKAYDIAKTKMQYIIVHEALDKFNGNQVQAAKWLGLNRATFRKYLKRFGYERHGTGSWHIAPFLPRNA